MGAQKIATSLFLAGGLLAAVVARSQGPEPPPYQGQGEEGAAGASPVIEAATNDPAAASNDYFHEQLEPYGQWTTHEGVGDVWVPKTDPGWRPYTTGHWANTDQGLAWAADEPWGWAPFHYGRWTYYQDTGWAWAPGNVWAPAWVSWRQGGGYLGWAPLPPTAGFTEEAGLDTGSAVLSPGFYTFVAEQNVLSPRVSNVIVPSTRNEVIVRQARDVTRYDMVDHHIVNSGVDIHHIERVIGHPVPRTSMLAGGRGQKGPFYQPQVVTRAAGTTHAEFGHALASQVAVQQRSHAQRSTSASSAEPAARPRRELSGTSQSTTTGGRMPRQTYPSRTPNSAQSPHAGSVQPSGQSHPAAGTQTKSQPKPQPQKSAPAKGKSKDKPPS